MKSPLGTSPGFTLVEVALALAILTVGMVGVMALLPVGLDSARQVYNETSAASLARSVLANLQINYSALSPNRNLTNEIWFATVEGVRTTSSNPPAFFQIAVNWQSSPGAPATNQPVSTRAFVTIRWPLAALNANSTNIQTRTFFTDVLRNPKNQ
jgi:uncharacterized protein (TIGR02598 family)